MGSNQSCVNRKVGRRTGISLNIDTPLGWVQLEGFSGSLMCQEFNFVNDFIASVVPSSRLSFGVLVMQTRSQAIQDRSSSEIFTGDHFKSMFLSLLFFTDQSVEFRIFDFEWIAQCPFLVS